MSSLLVVNFSEASWSVGGCKEFVVGIDGVSLVFSGGPSQGVST